MSLRTFRRVLGLALLSVVVADTSPLAAGSIVSVTLEFERQALDLETGAVFDLDAEGGDGEAPRLGVLFLDHPEADFRFAYSALGSPHAVLFHNQPAGVEIAFLSGTPFNLVDLGTLEGLGFAIGLVDRRLETGDTVILRTAPGVHFKIGNAVESELGVSFDYERLEESAASLPAEVERSTAEGPGSEALRLVHEYRIERAEGAEALFAARNAAQRFAVTLGEGGVRIAGGAGDRPAWTWDLSLRAYGYPGGMRPPQPAHAVARGNRFELRRAELVEWYVNEPRGFEQGFTLAERPGPAGGGPLTLEISSSGSLLPRAAGDSSGLLLVDSEGRRVLRYTGLVAWDAGGRVLPARMSVVTGGIRLEVEDADAAYPVTVDPTVVQEAKLVPVDGAARDYFGFSVALSGNTAAVGAVQDDDRGDASGSVYVYERDQGGPGAWGLAKKIVPADGQRADFFGYAVALSGDRLLVGAYGVDEAAVVAGAGYVFERDAGGPGQWGQVAKLLPADAPVGARMGYSVDLSGTVAVLGAFSDPSAGPWAGSAYVFERDAGGPGQWGQSAKLLPSDATAGKNFGYRVAVSGPTAVVGAIGDRTPVDVRAGGAAYVFERDLGGPGNWGEAVKLIDDAPTEAEFFGRDVGARGDRVAVGAPYDVLISGSRGSATLFERDAGGPGSWGRVVKLEYPDQGGYSRFGEAVEVGETAVLVGAGFANRFNRSGHAYLFDRDYGGPASWGLVVGFTSVEASIYARFGETLSMDGELAAIGAYFDDPHGLRSGAAYVFRLPLNEPPVVESLTVSADPVPVGSPVTATATFSDPDAGDTHTAAWSWGDGTTTPGTVVEADGSGSVTDEHVYEAAGVYTVGITVTDDGGLSDAAEHRYAVVYDPEGGFVTGGGWIESPAGAYVADPSITGRATFGFFSRYQKGATAPTGATRFRFRMADLAFFSDDYQWLVVAGARAQFKGVGTINGAGTYGFLLTAIDGQLPGGGGADKFRIKIWEQGSGDLVYDNQVGSADDAPPTTVLGGGSVTIQK